MERGDMDMRITVIVDNLCGSSNLWGEHGLSFFLETPRGSLLWDTGQGHSLTHNLSELNVSIDAIDGLALSHGHYDHCGGAPQLLWRRPDLPIWGSSSIMAPHYRRTARGECFIGLDLDLERRDFRPVKRPTEILPNLWAFSVPAEKRDPNLTLRTSRLVVPQGESWAEDPFHDDMSLLAFGAKGPSIVLGCAHSGVLNILRYVMEEFDLTSINTVIGGMHLGGMTSDKWSAMVHFFDDAPVERWRPCHCTGFYAASQMASRYTDVVWASSGTNMDI